MRGLLGTVTLVLLAGPASAALGPGASFPVGILAGPAALQVSAPAGQQSTVTIAVLNIGQEATRVTFSLVDLTPQGQPRPAATTPHTLVGFVVPPVPVIIPPGQTLQVPIVVTSSGTLRYGGLVVSAGSEVIPVARVILKLVLAQPDAHPQLDARVTASRSGEITVTYANTGQTLLTGQGSAFLTSPSGEFLGRLELPTFTLLPGGSATARLTWPAVLPPETTVRTAITIVGVDAPFVTSATVS